MKFRKFDLGFTGLGMTPLITVIFQLIMFLMIAIQFQNTKADEREKLPKSVLAKPPEVKTEHELVLNFGYETDQGGIRRSAVPSILHNERRIYVSDLPRELEQEKRTLQERHGQDIVGQVTVMIRADSDVPTGMVQHVVRICQNNGFSSFVYQSM